MGGDGGADALSGTTDPDIAGIAKELGMDAGEVLRLKQISGLAELFGDETFSQAWAVE